MSSPSVTSKHTPPRHPAYPSRSCLKRSRPPSPLTLYVSLPDSHLHPHVHFPPTPSLHQTFPTHSKRIYDRTSLVVLPNECVIPARGAPGRTYVDSIIKDDEVEGDKYEGVDLSRHPGPQLVLDQINDLPDESDDIGAPTSPAFPFDSMSLDFLPHVPARGYACRLSWGRRSSDLWERSKECSGEKESDSALASECLRQRERERSKRPKEERKRARLEQCRWKVQGLRGILPLSGELVGVDDNGCFGGF